MRPKNMEILQASVVVDLYFILIPVVYRFENLKVYWLSIEWKEVHLQKSMQAAANSSSCLQRKKFVRVRLFKETRTKFISE